MADEMMRRFVGGLVFDERGRILLVERAGTDPDMGGLWSLPAGGVDPGESDQEALAREFVEETGLRVDVGDEVTTVQRPSWCVATYHACIVGGTLDPNADEGIAGVGWFAVDKLPELMVLEARVAVVRHILASRENLSAALLTATIDGLFSALFHSYIRPSMRHIEEIEHSDLVRWAILNTPHRKFKSAVPFLLSDLSAEAGFYAVVAEALFGLWCILDDVSDDRLARYGVPTALHRFGRGQTVAFLFGAVEWFYRALHRGVGDAYARQIIETLLICANSQYDRFHAGTRTVDEYLSAAAMRTQFLGVAWGAGLEAIGLKREATALRELHRETSRFGQLLNDYFDLTRPDGLRDVHDKVRSAYVIKLAEIASDTDRMRLAELWDSPDRTTAKAEFREMAAQYSLTESIRTDLYQRLQFLINSVQSLPLTESQRAVLTGWLELSLKDVLPGDSDSSFKINLQRFLSGFEDICRFIP